MSGVVAYLNQLKERQGVSVTSGIPHEDCSLLIPVDVLDALARIALAALALYERVEMDESVGICLSDRVPSLQLGARLAELSRAVDRSRT